MTLLEVIEAVKDRLPIDEATLRLAVLALDGLNNHYSMEMMNALERAAAGLDPQLGAVVPTAFALSTQVLKSTPEQFIGWRGNPDNPDFQRRREVAKTLLSKSVH